MQVLAKSVIWISIFNQTGILKQRKKDLQVRQLSRAGKKRIVGGFGFFFLFCFVFFLITNSLSKDLVGCLCQFCHCCREIAPAIVQGDNFSPSEQLKHMIRERTEIRSCKNNTYSWSGGPEKPPRSDWAPSYVEDRYARSCANMVICNLVQMKLLFLIMTFYHRNIFHIVNFSVFMAK